MTKASMLDHVGISVADLDTMQQWYSETFELRVVNRFEVPEIGLRGAFLAADTGWVIELLERAGSQREPRATNQPERLLQQGLAHLCLRVNDVQHVHAQVLAAGGMERMPPQASPEPGVTMSFVADPEGNFIELIDRKGATQ